MDFEWDWRKAPSNLKKHGIDFADATGVFYDEYAITLKESVTGEERFITIGTDILVRVLVVVYTWREDRVRIISARKATSGERRKYEGYP